MLGRVTGDRHLFLLSGKAAPTDNPVGKISSRDDDQDREQAN
jgi:hypothetical protein